MTMEKVADVVAKRDAQLIVLPECFLCQIAPNSLKSASEMIPTGFACTQLAKTAKELGVFIVGGTIVEKESMESDKMFNTVTVWSPEGQLVTKYRKLHSFDVNLPDLQVNESKFCGHGNDLVTFDIGGFRAGLGVCYDLRFEEMAKLLRLKGCNLLLYPGAFNMITGPVHWEILQRARAIDNQCYVATISPSRNKHQGYVSYGYSMIVDPWGTVLNSAQDFDATVVADLGKSLFYF